MPPKKGGKKGKKGQDDDDEYWEAKAAALIVKSPPPDADDSDTAPSKPKSQAQTKPFNAFDLLENGDGGDDSDEGGGLLGTISKSKKKDKDKKSKKKKGGDVVEEEVGEEGEEKSAVKVDVDDEWPEEDVQPKKGKKGKKGKAEKVDVEEEKEGKEEAVEVPETKVDIDDEWPEEDVKPKKGKKGKKGKAEKVDVDEDEVVKEDAAEPEETKVDVDDEWPEEDVKPKKGKKGKKGKAGKVEEDEDDWMKEAEKKEEVVEEKKEEPVKAEAKAEEPVAEEDDGEDGDGTKILSKAQKDKLKKEKEKAKKKAQAAAKKAGPATTVEPVEETPVAPEAQPEADDDSGDEGGNAADKKKKKKKKPAAKVVVPEPAKPKKQSAHIAAMQAAMEEKKRIEEEGKRAEAERIRLLEEEDARIAEEEQRIADQKAAKKAKEKEKLAKAKAEGRILTPAQKREKAAAEARKQAMLDDGMTVAGLQEGAGERRKPTFDRRKKGGKPGLGKNAQAEGSTPASPVIDKEETVESAAPAPKADAQEQEDWDKSEDDAAAVEAVVAGVDKLKVQDEDDWDKSSGEDEAPAKSTTTAARSDPTATGVSKKSDTAPPASDSKVTAPASAKANGTAKPNGKPAPAKVEESSEEESDDDDDDSDEDSDESDSSEDEAAVRKAQALIKIQQRQQAAEAAKSKEDLRSPICCILGHVDTGKTKLLDKIRQTSVQEGEAGGITQQIGATFFPKDAILEKTAVVNEAGYDIKVPGLLIIDTPGHESFSNLRTRGSSLCNIAILVVDITHGLEPQTIESMNLLKAGKTPFIVALNKIDRMYGWKATPNGGFRQTLALQNKSVISEFEDRVKKTKLAFAEQGFNAEIFDENKSLAKTVSLVPTSAVTGEGIPDMLMLLIKLTQERMNASLMYISELECTIMEVKMIEGLGTTIDVILSNGVMREGDKIVLCGTDGPIVTNVRALLTPEPLREMRVKSAYVHHKECKAALGVKISAPGLEKAIAGARLYVAQDDDEVEAYKDLAMQDVNDLQRFASKGPGVWVQASTLGSLEALLTFLQQMKIPVRNFAIGPVFKSHVLRAGRMLETASEYALILAFDVQIDKDAKEYADKEGVKIFSAMIIYHLFDAFKKYMGEVQEAKRLAAMPNAVWPVRLSILKAFAHRDPIVLGVDIIEGSLRTGTPVGVVKVDKESGKREVVKLGKITSIEINHKPFEIVKKSQIGAGAAIKIERAPYEAARSYGRHFDDKEEVVSLISRQSIDTLKNSFRDQVDLTEWAMIKKMKTEQNVS